MKRICISIFVLCNISIAQTKNNYFEKQVITSDVNFDNIKDVIQVYQDTINPKGVYRLEISLAEIDSVGKNQIVATEKAIKSDFPDAESIDDRFWSGEMFDKIEVKNCILKIQFNLSRGYYFHKYRFNGESFDLIGFYKSESDGHQFTETINYDLLSGVRKTSTERFDVKQKPKIKIETIKLNQLPKLGEFTPLENELY